MISGTPSSWALAASGLVALVVAAVIGVAWYAGLVDPKEMIRAVMFLDTDRPRLEGPYAVGFASVDVKTGSDGPSLPVDIWYPAQAPGDGMGRSILQWIAAVGHPTSPPFTRNGKLSEARAKYPLIIYFPSWFSVRQQSTFTPANLASHGFIVATVDDIVHAPRLPGREGTAQASEIPGDSMESFEAYRPVAALRAELAAKSGSAIIDAFQNIPVFGQRVDMAKVGAVGFSFGGATAAQMSSDDRRIKAVVNFDGSLYGRPERGNVEVPYMMFYSGWTYPTCEELLHSDFATRINSVLTVESVAHQIRQATLPNNWTFTVKGTVHDDFADKLAKPPWKAAFDKTAINRAKTWSEINRYVVAFFNRFLLGENQPLLTEPAPFAEIRPFMENQAPPQDRASATGSTQSRCP